jgi:hypothetical protein
MSDRIDRITIHAKKRDAYLMLAEAENDELELLKPQEGRKKSKYDLSKIKTERTEGPSGFYQKATEQDNEDYRNLVEDLKAHDGKLTRDGFWIWLFSDEKTVGMKPSKK